MLLSLQPLVVAAPAPGQGPGNGETAEHLTSIRILSPSPSDVPWGSTVVRVSVTPPEGRTILRVEIFVDGVLLASDPLPPYESRWEAGESLASRVIRAVALLDDGSRAEELVTTRGLRLHEHELVEATALEHVELLVSVTNAEGKPVRSIAPDDFVVRESGRPVPILRASHLSERADLPLSIALLVDRSGSMRIHMEKIARAAVALVGVIRPIDQVRVAAFSEEMVVLQDFTRDPFSLLESLTKVGPPVGGTRLFKAIDDTARDMRDRPGRKVIVVLTDGLDTDFTSPSSPVTSVMYPILRDVAAAASRAGVTVIVILPGPSGRGYLAVQDLALQTGGWYAYPGEDFAQTVRELGERFLSSWVLEYDVERSRAPDRKRPVEVTLAGGLPAGWEIRAAMGAYAGLDLFEALAADMQEGTTSQRARAAREIGYFPGEEAAELLREALDDGEAEVRVAAIESLSERREPRSMEKIVGLLRDPDPLVRRSAFEGAVRYGSEAVRALSRTARGRGEGRDAALRALGTIGGDQAIALLTESLSDASCGVRSAAAEASGILLAAQTGVLAGSSGRSAGVEGLNAALRRLLEDPCAAAAEAARAALRAEGVSES